MVNDEPSNNNSEQAESIELIPLAPLLENPDPDFDVVVTKGSHDISGRIELATDDARPNLESKQA